MRSVSTVAILLVIAASAIAQTPTPDQLQIFQNLSPQQQQAVLEQLAGASQPNAAHGEATGANGVTSGTEADNRRLATTEKQQIPAVPVLAAEDSVLVEVALPEETERLGLAETSRLERLAALIGSRNPYQLDRNGQLYLPGFAPIALGGLSERQATQRLQLEPVLLPLKTKLSLLPLAKVGANGLSRFGYDLFDNAPSTFSPVTDVPVPADYVIGPGDRLDVLLYGNQSRSVSMTVNRDGGISFPELGPIRIGGLTFTAARQAIESRVTQQMTGVQASVTMGDTRAIRVFVLGEARLPGSYTVSGLATMTTALFASGGVREIGSLRDIQLKRQGQIIRRLDLYDLLVRGDTSDDAKLLPGDVIFIPPVGATVSVDGEVKRPAIYELFGETSVSDLVGVAGGLTPEADASRTSLLRIGADGQRVVVDVNIGSPSDQGRVLQNGDVLHVASLRPQLDSGVVLEGFVYRPGTFAWREGLRLTDIIGSVDELKPGADQHYVLIRRERASDRRISVISADLGAALFLPDSEANPILSARDRITVFDLGPGRERIIQPLVEELKLQSALSDPTELVRVGGRVKVPGEYPLEPGMTVSDLIRAGGNLESAAYGGSAELTRYAIGEDGSRQTQLVMVDLSAIRRGDSGADLALQPFDFLLVKETPDWTGQESVTLRGEVRFPGTYPIRKGETLRQVLERAGGLTSVAFPEGSVFSRAELRVNEQLQLDRLAGQMRKDLAAMALQAASAGQSSASESLQSGQALLAQLQGTRATGRFVIDLPVLLASQVRSPNDVELRDGDELTIPKRRQEVTVIGEVQNATSHLHQIDLQRDDYISLSGGTTKKADRRRIYVVRADGRTATRGGSFFARNYDPSIKPGDTIVVPLDTERMPRLPLWQAVTQILYNLAVSVAAINSF